jgi:transposase
MARPRTPFPAGSGAEAKRLMKSCADPATFRRLQAVFLAADQDLSNAEIAKITELSINTIRVLHVRARRAGVSSLLKKPKGGRFREHLAKAQESAVLKRIIPDAARGGMVVVSDIKAQLEATAGRTYHLHSVYRLLARHGWRKIAPRRRHPDQDPTAVATFQKSGRTSSRISAMPLTSTGVRRGSSSKTKPASAGSATRGAAGPRPKSARSSTLTTSANTPTSSPPSTRSRVSSRRSSPPR